MFKNWIGVTTVALVVGFGSGPLGAGKPLPARQSEQDGDASQAPRLAASADGALKKGDATGAILLAEKTVALLPHDAGSRLLLGRTYLAAGRFVSAETVLGDALTLDPSLGRAAILRAFAQIANGRSDAALASLEAARGLAPESEIGLALAMMGRDTEAQPRLEAAARAKDADARSRQNLAFAHALQGRWADAAAVAAQDVPADQLADRLRRWAMIAQLRSAPAMQVGAMFGVLPAQDGGLPVALALAAPAPARTPATAPLLAAAPQPAAELPAPVAVAEPSKSAAPLVVTPMAAATPAPISILAATPIAVKPIARIGITPAPLLAAPAPLLVAAAPIVPVTPVEAPRPIMAAQPKRIAVQPVRPLPAPTLASAPVARPEAMKATFKPAARSGQWVVQLGAFSTEARTAVAWTRISHRAGFLAGYQPVKGSFRKAGATLHRLSISGFATRDDAVQVCLKIRATGSPCFVRGNIGDRSLRMAQDARPGRPA